MTDFNYVAGDFIPPQSNSNQLPVNKMFSMIIPDLIFIGFTMDAAIPVFSRMELEAVQNIAMNVKDPGTKNT